MQLLAMEREPLDEDPSPLQPSKSRALLNPLPVSPPFSTHLVHRPFHSPSETLPHPFSVSFTAQHLPSAALPLHKEYSHAGKLPSQQRRNGELQESDEDEQQYSREDKEEKNKGGSLHYRGGNSISGKEKEPQDQMYGKEHAYTYESSRDDQSSAGHTVESPGASVGEGSPEAFTPPEVSGEEDNHMGSGASESQSENENTNSNDSSSGKGIAHEHQGEKGEVSPLRALSHIAHIKRKQDCMQVRDLHSLEDMHELSDDVAHGSPSKNKRFKQVQFQLESLSKLNPHARA